MIYESFIEENRNYLRIKLNGKDDMERIETVSPIITK